VNYNKPPIPFNKISERDLSPSLRIVLIVSPDRSDVYFANQLLKNLNVVGVFVEQQKNRQIGHYIRRLLKYILAPWEIPNKVRNDHRHRQYRKKSSKIDRNYFGEQAWKINSPEKCKVVYTKGKNAINNIEYVNEVRNLKPDLISICGSSILRNEILSVAPKGVLNLHSGLSQVYRGTWTTLWAIYNREPEYVGATVHYVSAGIDDGDIIYQGRPEIQEGDNPETLYAKVVKLGVQMMLRAISDIQNGTVKSYRLEQKGKLYLKKMMSISVRDEAWKNAESNVITNYLNDKNSRDKAVQSIMMGVFCLK